MYKSGGRNVWVLIVFMMAGVVLGGLISGPLVDFAQSHGANWINWLDYGIDFGISPPFTLDLSVATVAVGFTLRMTIAGILCMAAAIFLYKRL